MQVILTFLAAGVVFIPLGVICLFASQGVCELNECYLSFFSHLCFLDYVLSTCFIISYMKVVEIVDRYDTDCVPESSRANKVAYIQSEGNKMCNRTITVRQHLLLDRVVSVSYGCFTNLSLFLQVTKTMKHPIYVYYQLENYYQNHRRYCQEGFTS